MTGLIDKYKFMEKTRHLNNGVVKALMCELADTCSISLLEVFVREFRSLSIIEKQVLKMRIREELERYESGEGLYDTV